MRIGVADDRRGRGHVLPETALDAVRTFGGYGYLADYGVERALRDSVGGLIYSGTNDIQRNIIGRWLGL